MKRFYSIILVFLLLVVTVSAEIRPVKVKWKDCVDLALKNNPGLQSAREKYNAAKADLERARSGYYPQISADASYARKKTDSAGNRSDSLNEYSYSLSAKQLLFDGFKSSSGINAARKGISEQENSYNVASSEARVSLRTAFVQLIKAQESHVIAISITLRRKDNRDLVKLRYDSGMEHRGALLTAEANFAKAKVDEAQALRDIDLARQALATAIGLERNNGLEASGDMLIDDKYQAIPDFNILAANHPSMSVIAAQREAARYNIEAARSGNYPGIYASASAGRKGQAFPPSSTELSVGLSASMPLFEGGSTAYQVCSAKAKYNQLVADEKKQLNSIVLSMQQKWTALRQAIDAVSVEEQYLTAATERSKIAQAQYSIGMIQFDNWILIEDELVRARKSCLEAKVTALISEAEWQGAQGVTLDYDR